MKVGPYEVLGTLGRGATGVVYRARSAAGEEVAVKVIASRDADRIARFERERRLQGELGLEAGFVPLVDSGTVPGGLYLVMPLVPDGTLRQRLDRGPLGVEATIELGCALARALGRAHRLGVVHRDVKPESIIFTASGRPLVVDLGLAKHFDAGAPGASQSVALSVQGSLRGTAGYMPPEQVRDATSVGPPADVFALGAILHECLTGRPTFVGQNLVDLLARVVAGNRERLAGGDAPPWLAAAIDRALSVRPGDRFEDGAAFARALEARKARSRAPTRWIVGAAVVALLGAGAAWSRSGRKAPEAENVAPKSTTRLWSEETWRRLQRGASRLDAAALDAVAAAGSECPAEGRAAIIASAVEAIELASARVNVKLEPDSLVLPERMAAAWRRVVALDGSVRSGPLEARIHQWLGEVQILRFAFAQTDESLRINVGRLCVCLVELAPPDLSPAERTTLDELTYHTLDGLLTSEVDTATMKALAQRFEDAAPRVPEAKLAVAESLLVGHRSAPDRERGISKLEAALSCATADRLDFVLSAIDEHLRNNRLAPYESARCLRALEGRPDARIVHCAVGALCVDGGELDLASDHFLAAEGLPGEGDVPWPRLLGKLEGGRSTVERREPRAHDVLVLATARIFCEKAAEHDVEGGFTRAALDCRAGWIMDETVRRGFRAFRARASRAATADDWKKLARELDEIMAELLASPR